MGLCKCRNVTSLFCFQHRKNVCESCILTDHKSVKYKRMCFFFLPDKLQTFGRDRNPLVLYVLKIMGLTLAIDSALYIWIKFLRYTQG